MRKHALRQMRNIKEQFRLLVEVDLCPFSFGCNVLTQEEYVKLFKATNLDESYFLDNSITRKQKIDERKQQITNFSEGILSFYISVLDKKEVNILNEILNSYFIMTTIVPMNFNIPNEYRHEYPSNQEEMGESIYELYKKCKNISLCC